MRALFLVLLVCFCGVESGFSVETNRHVVLVVWDGMRPDFVNETNTPTLSALARRGVFFKNNHSVYISSTEVNGTALATGAYPQHSGLIANMEYRPQIDPAKPVATDSMSAIRKGDEHGDFFAVPTLAEILHQNGLNTAITGSKPVVILHDRAERSATSASSILFEGQTLPAGLASHLTNTFGSFPAAAETKTNRDLWTTRVLIGEFWKKEVPPFSLLWLAEPDFSQHATGVGSPQSLMALRHSDNALSLVIESLKEKGVYDSTDIIVVSDHGFSTIKRQVDATERLRKAGFKAVRSFKTAPAKGDVLVVGLGGSVLLYVIDHDKKTIDNLVSYLQKQDFAGVIFTERARAGTFAMEDASIHSRHAPDIVFSFRWIGATNVYGAPGELIADGLGSSSPMPNGNLKGTHASLSPFDLHNTLIAAGPDFRQGLVNETPSGNVDVAPTILHLLGIKPPATMDGRVLMEALNSATAGNPKVNTRELKASAKSANGLWTQSLSISEVNGVRYLNEGSGEFVPGESATETK
jgi:arylsulfatase A-like enzyme